METPTWSDLRAVPYRKGFQEVPAICKTTLTTRFQDAPTCGASSDPTGSRRGFTGSILAWDPRNPKGDGSANERPSDWDYWAYFYNWFHVTKVEIVQLYTMSAVNMVTEHGCYIMQQLSTEASASNFRAQWGGYDKLWKDAGMLSPEFRPVIKTYNPHSVGAQAVGTTSGGYVGHLAQPTMKKISRTYDILKFFQSHPYDETAVTGAEMLPNVGWSTTGTDTADLNLTPILQPRVYYGLGTKSDIAAQSPAFDQTTLVETFIKWHVVFTGPSQYIIDP